MMVVAWGLVVLGGLDLVCLAAVLVAVAVRGSW